MRQSAKSMGWHYLGSARQSDTPVTALMLRGCELARGLKLWYHVAAADGGRKWINKMTDPEFGQVGYMKSGGQSSRFEGLHDKFPTERTQCSTALGIVSRLPWEDPRQSEMIRKGSQLCLEVLPEWNPDSGSIDMYFWYFGSQALFQVGGSTWKKWNEAMKDALLKHQHPSDAGAKAGSWDPIGAWGSQGGRVFSTAICTLTLETYNRYPRYYGRK